MGRQSQLMWVGIAGFWGCGVPLGYTLAFPTKFGISGLWLGALAGSLIVGKHGRLTHPCSWQSFTQTIGHGAQSCVYCENVLCI